MRRSYVDTGFGQVHHYTAGESGPRLFLFHETPLSGSEFERVLPILGERCRVIAFDTPGYGMSDPSRAPLDMEGLSTRLYQAIQTFGEEPCILAGVHTGSSIAIELATKQLKGRVTHVVMSGIALLSPKEIEDFRKIFRSPDLDREGRFLIKLWQQMLQRWGKDTDLEDILWGTAEQLKVYMRSYWALDTGFSHDVEAALAALKKLACPVLFLVGDQDSLVESDKRAAKLVPDATLKILPGVRGRLPYFEPEIYAREVLEFAGLR